MMILSMALKSQNNMRNIFLSIFGIFLCVFAAAQTPKKIVIDGGAAPTNTSQLTNDVPFTSRAELNDSLAALEARIETYELAFQGDAGGILDVTNAETFVIGGGPGLRTAGSVNTLTVSFDLPSLTNITGAQVSGTDELLIWRGGTTYRAISASEFANYLPNTITLDVDGATDAPLTLSSTFTFAGTGGLDTDYNGGTNSLTVNYDPFSNLSSRSAATSDFITTYDNGGNIGRTTISSILSAASYDFDIQADVNGSVTISDGDVIDFEGGSGIQTERVDVNDIDISMDIGELTTIIPNTSDFVVWADASTNVHRKVAIGNLPISSGSGDITGVTAGDGLSGGATSGNATVNLDISSLPNLATSSNYGVHWIPLRTNASDNQYEIQFQDLVQSTFTSTDNSVTITYDGAEQTVDFSAGTSSVDWDDITGKPSEFDAAIDGVTSSAASGVDLSISFSDLLSADLDIAELPFKDDNISYNDRLALYGLTADNGSSNAQEYEVRIRDAVRASIYSSDNSVTISTPTGDFGGRINLTTSNSISAGDLIDLSGLEINVDLSEANDYGSTLSDSDHVIVSTGTGSNNNRRIDFDDFISDLNANRKAITSVTSSSTSAVFLDEEDECYMHMVADGGTRVLTLPTASGALIGKKVFLITEERNGGSVLVTGSSRVRNGNNTVTSGSLGVNDGMFVCMRDPDNSASYVWMFIGS